MTRKDVAVGAKNLNELRSKFKKVESFAEIMMPHDAEEPILAPAVRAAVLEWMVEIRHAAALGDVGVKARRSALLYGPPGTGKTTLAHHLAARLGVVLVAVQSDQLVASSLGRSSHNAASLFEALRDVDGQCVVLLDEIDSIGSRRSTDDQACSREMNSLLTTLLRYVEGYSGIFVGATNRREELDPALWRRFGMQLSVDLPGLDERFAIIRRYAAPFDLPDDDIDALADATIGASPALLRQLVEGVKRRIAIAPKLNHNIPDAGAALRAVVASVAMPPEFEVPPLWRPHGVANLPAMTWPWPKMGGGK